MKGIIWDNDPPALGSVLVAYNMDCWPSNQAYNINCTHNMYAIRGKMRSLA